MRLTRRIFAAVSAYLPLAAAASLVLAQAAAAQPAPASAPRPVDTAGLSAGRPWALTITADELREHAYVLASDSLRGRETGEPGQRLAAAYLSAEMAALDLPRVGADDSYEQPIAFASFAWDSTALAVDGEPFEWLRAYYGLPAQVAPLDGAFDDVAFVGYGVDAPAYSDYRVAERAGVDLRGRVAVALAGEPFGKTGASLVGGTADSTAWSRSDSLKLAAAERAGLAALLLVAPDVQARALALVPRILERGLRAIPPGAESAPDTAGTSLLHVSPGVFEALVGDERRAVVKARRRIARRGAAQPPVRLPGRLSLAIEPTRSRLEGSNVLGYVPGSDPAVADELVVVSAHYDHLGERGDAVFNGADDNASGTSTVLEIAEALAAARRAGQGPRRSVLCLLVSGEEKGLLGSQYYAENPTFPLERTVADVNIDMIGRYDESHADSAAYIYVIGAGRISPDLDAAVRALNAAADEPLALDYAFDDPEDPNRFYYRSDHYNFAKNGVPSVFYFSGVHEDYHRPSDTPDKLDYDKMVKVGRHAFLVVWNLANREGPLAKKPPSTLPGSAP